MGRFPSENLYSIDNTEANTISQVNRSDSIAISTRHRAFHADFSKTRPIPVEFDYQFPRRGARCIPRGLFTRLKVAGKRKKKASFNSRLLLARVAVDLLPPVFAHPRKWHLFPNFASLPPPPPPPFNYIEGREVWGPSPETFHENWTEIRPVNVDYDSLERSQRR